MATASSPATMAISVAVNLEGV